MALRGTLCIEIAPSLASIDGFRIVMRINYLLNFF